MQRVERARRVAGGRCDLSFSSTAMSSVRLANLGLEARPRRARRTQTQFFGSAMSGRRTHALGVESTRAERSAAEAQFFAPGAVGSPG
jgi:hypothetical protein